jgi:tRNA1Val (adenine37-N6)-methyltransferase
MPLPIAPAGVVRRARRPPGWRAPGPAPAGPRGRPELAPGAGEDLCYLAGDWRIFQPLAGHRWSLDDLVTAWLAAGLLAGSPPARVVDLGCGLGSVLLLLAWRFSTARLTGVEARAERAALARRSIAWNGVEDRCEVRVGDLRDPAALPEGAAFDLVTGTPPYLRPGTATESHLADRSGCHFEHRGGIEAYCAAAASLLAPGAPFVACAAAAQGPQVERAAAASGLALDRRLDVVPRAGKPPLFTVFALRHSSVPATVRVEPPLVVRDAAGRRTPAFRAVRAMMGMP